MILLIKVDNSLDNIADNSGFCGNFLSQFDVRWFNYRCLNYFDIKTKQLIGLKCFWHLVASYIMRRGKLILAGTCTEILHVICLAPEEFIARAEYSVSSSPLQFLIVSEK